MKKEVLRTISVTAIISSAISVGFFYLFFNSELKTAHEEKISLENRSIKQMEQNNELKNLLLDIEGISEVQKKEIERLTCSGEWKDGTCVGKPITLLKPRGGESLCLGEQFIIEWQAGQANFAESILVRVTDGSVDYDIGRYPVTFNEEGIKKYGYGMVPWTVGMYDRSWPGGRQSYGNLIKEGHGYQIWLISKIRSTDGNFVTQEDDISDPFSIIRCQG